MNRGMPPAAGGCAGGCAGGGGPCPSPDGGGGCCPPPDGGGGLENVRLWCPPGGNARVCPRLPPVSLPAAAFIVFCCACSFAMFSLSYSKYKNQNHYIEIIAESFSKLLLAYRAGLFCLLVLKL
jgi:hypothetical protein